MSAQGLIWSPTVFQQTGATPSPGHGVLPGGTRNHEPRLWPTALRAFTGACLVGQLLGYQRRRCRQAVGGPAAVLSGRASFGYSAITRFATPGEEAAKRAKKAQTLERPRRSIQRTDVELRYSRSSGPGGQNVNKVETKVEARFDVEYATFLPDWVKQRVRTQEKSRINKEGILVVSCQEERSQADNQRIVMQKLQDIIDSAAEIPKVPDVRKKARMAATKKRANEKRLEQKKYNRMRKQRKRMRD